MKLIEHKIRVGKLDLCEEYRKLIQHKKACMGIMTMNK